MTIDEAYEKVNAIKPEGEVRPLTIAEAEKAVRKMYRHLTGKKFPYRIVETSGNRYTWLRGMEFRVNCEKGWDDLIHLFSHWYHRNHFGGKPHNKKHARLEKNLRKWAVDKGWFSGSLKREEKIVEEVNPIQVRAEKARKMMEKWEKKLKRAKNLYAKWTKKVAYYDKKINQEG